MDKDLKKSEFSEKEIKKGEIKGGIAAIVIIGWLYLSFLIDNENITNCIFIVVMFGWLIFIEPVRKIINKKRKEGYFNKIEMSMAAFSGIIIILLIYTMYKITNFTVEDWEKNNILYYGIIICVYFLMILTIIKNYIVELEKKSKLKKSTFRYAGKITVFVLFLISISGIYFYGIYEEKEDLVLNNMKEPTALEVKIINGNLSKINRDDYRKNVITIEEKSIINELMNDLEGKKISNIRLLERIGYESIKYGDTAYYEIIPLYESKHRVAYGKALKEGYISKIKVYENKYAIVQVRIEKKEAFKNINYKKYKLPISQSIINQIIKTGNAEDTEKT